MGSMANRAAQSKARADAPRADAQGTGDQGTGDQARQVADLSLDKERFCLASLIAH